MRDFIDILIAKLAIWRIKHGYGCFCKTRDIDDMPETFNTAQSVFHSSRCPSCRAKEIVDWLEDHIRLIKGK